MSEEATRIGTGTEANVTAGAPLPPSEEKYRALFEAVGAGYAITEFVLDSDGTPADCRVVEFNEAFGRLFVGSRELFVNGPTAGVQSPEVREEWCRLFGRAAVTGERVRHALWVRDRDEWFDVSAFRIGEPHQGRVALVFSEATARYRSSLALRASEERYRALAANLPNGAAFVVGHDLRITLADGEGLRAAGFSPTDFEGKTLSAALGAEIAVAFEPHFRRALAGAPFRVEHAAHGRHFITHGGPLRDAGGHITAALAVSFDISARVWAEEKARAGQEWLRLILASATDHAIFTLAPDRTVTDWSTGAEAMFGYPGAEILGRSGDELFTPEDRAAGAPVSEIAEALRNGRAADERWHARKGGERFFASGALTPLAGGRGFVKVLRDLTDRKRIEDELLRTRDRLEESVAARTAELATALDSLAAEMQRRNELARRLTTAQEEERQRLARDLHDTVGQTLTGLALAAAAGQLDQVRRLADELSRELHDVAVRLRPTALDDLGLPAAARELVSEWSRRAKVPVDFQAVGEEGARLPRETETALYRVVQEALTNASRYAGARRVAVVVGRRGGEAVAVVEDDGFGFDPDAVPRTPIPGRRGGLGLVGMRERVELLGGTLEVDSAPGAGTTVIARIPLDPG
ncbi:MAG TPA: PAS domain-containing protein [Gemmata sp.]